MSSPLAEKISEVPKLYESGGKSTIALLRDTGYLQTRQALNIDDVEDALRRDPKLADLWLKRGSDQRIAGGWSIERDGGAYQVRNYVDGRYLRERDRVKACAAFVVRYVSFIADVVRRHHGVA